MSLVELVAGGLMGAKLLDAKYMITDDLLLVRRVFAAAIPFVINCARGKASYWYYFEAAVALHPNNTAVCFPRAKRDPPPIEVDLDGNKIYDSQFEVENITYADLYAMVLRFSYVLKNDYGVTDLDTIGIDCMNKPLFIIMWFALWNIGAVPAFLNFNIKDKPLIHSLKAGGVLQVFVDPDCAHAIRDLAAGIRKELPDVKLHYLDEASLIRKLNDEKTPKYRAPNATRRPQDSDHSCCALIYTSGTSGLPKPAIMSWRKAFMAATLFGYIMKIDVNSTVLTAMPLYHSTAAMLGVCPTLLVGGCVAISQKFSASSFWSQARITKATHIQYVGEVCRYLLNAAPHPDQQRHQVKIAYGNGLRPDIWLEFKDRFKIEAIGEFYASTESPIALTSLQYGEYGVGACRKYGSIINFMLSFQQQLVKMDPDDENEIWRDPATGLCANPEINEPGELMMRIVNTKKPETSFQGYYGNKNATSSKIIHDVFRKGDAWFRSGDLLRMDGDGLLYFVDRLGDTFRWKSENVSATEVENEISRSKLIKQVVVVGVKVPNHEGRAGFAVIELPKKLNTSATRLKILRLVYERLSKSLPKYAIPQFIKFIDTIEASHNHKVLKSKYKNQILPQGDDGTEIIYWLNQKQYEVLLPEAWDKIVGGKCKL